jgi:hypothetical protein
MKWADLNVWMQNSYFFDYVPCFFKEKKEDIKPSKHPQRSHPWGGFTRDGWVSG